MSQEWFALILNAGWKGSMIIATAWVASCLCRRQSAAVRHMIWATAILCALGLPIVSALLPGWESQVLPQSWTSSGSPVPAMQEDPSLPAMVLNAGLTAARGSSVMSWLFYLWLAGWAAGATLVASGMLRLWWKGTRAQALLAPEWIRIAAELTRRFGLPRPVRLLVSCDAVMPLTWGYFQPRVLLPADVEKWGAERIRVVLTHEFAHIKRRDWLMQLLAEAGRTLYWFNPLMWISCNRLRQESEQACDDVVLLSGVDGSDYAEHLLALARTLSSTEPPWAVSLAMAHRPHLERRFAAMLNPSIKRNSITLAARLVTALAAVCLLIPVASMRAPAQTLSGKFFGTVYDASGGAVPNATIIATNPQAQTKDMTTSNAAGAFEFSMLQAGEYSVEVLRPGFARLVVPVTLAANQSKNQDLTLQLGSVNERIEVEAQGVKAEPPQSSGQAPSRIRIGGDVQSTKIVKMVRPVYPPAAKAAGITGQVLLGAVISREGQLISLRVLNSQIDPDLAKAAVEAVSQWVYQPTLLNGVPVEIMTNITVNFTLKP